jgi:hypothetical protein
LCQIDDERFLVFGGFVEGSRTNDCYLGKKNGTTIDWEKIGDKSECKPCPRNSHSMAYSEGKCFVFGGQDDDTNKLCDLWEFTVET